MAKPTYSELLRDPRWQKMRLKKLEAAEWRCEACMDAENTLHVHHKRYVKGRMPWEYDEAELAVLCEGCHEGQHETKELHSALLARLDVDGPVSLRDFFAYGSGAISTHDWLLDATTLALLEQVRAEAPNLFAAGRAASAIFDLLIYNGFTADKTAVTRLAERLQGDQEFGGAFLAFLASQGFQSKED